MKTAVKILLVLVLFCQTGRAQSYVEAVVITNSHSGTVFSQNIVGYVNDATVGWTFSPLQNITVSSLGSLFNSSDIEIGLWDASGTLLRSTTLDDNKQAIGFNFYEAIDPILLLANENYVIAGSIPGQAYSIVGVLNSPTDSSIKFINSAFSPQGAGFIFPTITTTSENALFATTFLFEPVPEPGALNICVLGGIFLTWLRNRKCEQN